LYLLNECGSINTLPPLYPLGPLPLFPPGPLLLLPSLKSSNNLDLALRNNSSGSIEDSSTSSSSSGGGDCEETICGGDLDRVDFFFDELLLLWFVEDLGVLGFDEIVGGGVASSDKSEDTESGLVPNRAAQRLLDLRTQCCLNPVAPLDSVSVVISG